MIICILAIHSCIAGARSKEPTMAKKAGGKKVHRDSAKDVKNHKRGDKR